MVSSSSQVPASLARSLLCLVLLLSVTGVVIEVAAASYSSRTRMAGLQDQANGAHKPSRTLKQFDPHILKAQPLRRAGHPRPSPWSGNGQSQGNGDGQGGTNNDPDGNDEDDEGGDIDDGGGENNDHNGDTNEGSKSHGKDDMYDGGGKEKWKHS
ncbi:hypothetical protein NP233_g10535 [Leucocoprinus birnbaumii]|uniref:Uncharacterized protein n=1 Tax=Leucocoprinus birnbaumii TaxID=56174 RepID=A0AAD5VI66_9AGAR|nr:hypothetical protein NP233_g10535 [Leucocoprinus birnbaumii]